MDVYLINDSLPAPPALAALTWLLTLSITHLPTRTISAWHCPRPVHFFRRQIQRCKETESLISFLGWEEHYNRCNHGRILERRKIMKKRKNWLQAFEEQKQASKRSQSRARKRNMCLVWCLDSSTPNGKAFCREADSWLHVFVVKLTRDSFLCNFYHTEQVLDA
jgi:hypothetical protein